MTYEMRANQSYSIKKVLSHLNPVRGYPNLSYKKKSFLLMAGVAIIFSPLSIQNSFAVDSIWTGGTSNDWNTGTNWNTGIVPDGIAEFDVSPMIEPTLSANTSVNQILFDGTASTYTITLNGSNLDINGIGVTNTSANPQLFQVTAGSLAFNNGAVTDNAAITNADTLNFNDTSIATNSIIANSGSINFNGNTSAGASNIDNIGLVNFNANATAANSTINNAGVIAFNDNASAGTSIITNNGFLYFRGSSLADTASIVSNVFVVLGGTTAGIGIGSLSGTGNVALGNQTLTIGGLNTANEISGVISGLGGSLIKTGNETLTLSGANTYTGTTSVTSGTLFNTGSLTSQVTVSDGAIYQGNGSSLSLFNTGTVSPSSPTGDIGTMRVNGNFTQNPTATFQTKITPQGLADLLSVTGLANLNGTLNIVPVGSISSFGNKKYTILTANGGVAGTFSNIIAPALFKYNVRYFPNEVVINTGQLSLSSLVQGGNAGVIATYLDQIVSSSNVSADMDTVLQALDNAAASGNTALTQALNQMSPDPYRELGFLAFNQTNMIRETVGTQQQRILDTLVLKQLGTNTTSKGLVSKFQRLQNDIRMGLAFQPKSGLSQRMAKNNLGAQAITAGNIPLNKMVHCGKMNIWIQSFGALQDKKNGNNLAGTKNGSFGTTLGADLQVLPNTYLGVMAGGMGTDFDWKQNRGKGKLKSYYGGLYGLWLSKEGVYIDTQVTLGGDRYHTHRNINFGTINRTTNEKHKGVSVSTDLELGYLLAIQEAVIQPFINYAYMASHENGFSETGAGSLNIHRSKQTSQFGRSELGSIFSYFFACGETLIYPSIKLSWVQKHPLSGAKKVRFNFTDQTFSTTVLGDNRVRNLFNSGLSLTAQFKEGVYVTGNVNGEFGSGEKGGNAMVSVGYQF